MKRFGIEVTFYILLVCTQSLFDRIESANVKRCAINVFGDCQPGCEYFELDVDGCPTCTCLKQDPDIIEGDIKVDERTMKILDSLAIGSKEEKGALKDGIFTKWNNLPSDNGLYEVPYVIDSTLPDMTVEAIDAAISDYFEKTCIWFRPRKNEREYIRFFSDRGCYSYLGRITSQPPNKISLSPGCGHKGIVIHELMHALGFLHEQSRSDRDENVIIHYENIRSGTENNFRKYSEYYIDSRGSPYDFRSVMHYGSYAFSANKRPTITNKNGQTYKAQRSGFSEEDIKQINKMYDCKVTGLTATVTTTESTTTTKAVTTTRTETTTSSTTRQETPPTTMVTSATNMPPTSADSSVNETTTPISEAIVELIKLMKKLLEYFDA